MKALAREYLLPLIIGLMGSVIGQQTPIAVLTERVDNVKAIALEAKEAAQGAHQRIDDFLLGDSS